MSTWLSWFLLINSFSLDRFKKNENGSSQLIFQFHFHHSLFYGENDNSQWDKQWNFNENISVTSEYLSMISNSFLKRNFVYFSFFFFWLCLHCLPYWNICSTIASSSQNEENDEKSCCFKSYSPMLFHSQWKIW